jgi:hypothetical protein
MSMESVQGKTHDSMVSIRSHLVTALNIYIQGLVVAVFGALFYFVNLWIPLEYKWAGFVLGFGIFSYALGTVNSRGTKRFWSEEHRFSSLTLLGQGAVLLFISIFVLVCATTVFTIQMVGGPQVDPFFQIQLGVAATLISPPFYGLLARNAASWKLSL